jgi:hypothetical protein
MYKGALKDQATARYCTRARRTATAQIWGAVVLAVLVVVVGSVAKWSGGLIVPLALILIALAYLAGVARRQTKRYERILSVYPWQSHSGAAQVAQNGTVFLRLPNPEGAGKPVSVRVRRPATGRWRTIARANPTQEVWFAGDPRVGGVLALPGPRGFALALQGGAAGQAERANPERGGGPALRDMSEEALQRARSAGFGDGRFGNEIRLRA